jgi:hypothetical protein
LLHVAGNARIGVNDTSVAELQIGAGATGNRLALIDLVGDTTYSDFGLRILRDNTGANANSDIQHRGTGALRLITNEAAPVVLLTAGAERARIDSSGRLLVGTSSAFGQFPDGLVVNSPLGFTATFGRFTNDTNPGHIALYKGRGGAPGTRGTVLNNDFLGIIDFYGDDGSTLNVRGARIHAEGSKAR